MSTDYYVHCTTCDSTEFSSNEIRYYSTDSLKLLIKHATVIAQLSSLITDPIAMAYELNLSFYSLGHVDVPWYAVHASHELIIIDEYGKLLETE